jgi:hypothetical protein
MSLPKHRMTVTLAEYKLLKPALDVLANGLASAKAGRFPNRHPWHQIDNVASNVFRNREFDAEMSTRIVNVREKLWDLSQSRKIYLDVFELLALALALRLSGSQKLVDETKSTSSEIRLLQTKIEIYRRRAGRSAVTRIGRVEYRLAAQRWRRFIEWMRYNILYIKVPKRGAAWRATRWREQRVQLTQLITKILAERFFEIPSEAEMTRVVTLATTSLRRYRHSVGLRELLRSPQDHTDFLFGFIEKRLRLKRAPGAPVPAWQAMSDRADKFREYQNKTRGKISAPYDSGNNESLGTEREHQACVPPKAESPRSFTHNGQPLTAEVVMDTMAVWLYQELTMKFNLTREVCEQAQHQAKRGLLDQYGVKTTATSLNTLLQELRPTDSFTDIPSVINAYVKWLLEVLLALRQEPAWIYQAIGAICGQAMQLGEKSRYDECAATLANGSSRDSVGA